MGKFAEKLKEYFKNTPQEQLDADWEKIKHLNDIGPDVEEYTKRIEEEYYIKYQRSTCEQCKFYDGHDACLHKGNFGAIVEESIWRCLHFKLKKDKY